MFAEYVSYRQSKVSKSRLLIMKLGGQGIFDNAVFLVGTSVRKSTFLRLYKTKDHELSNSAFVLRSSRWIELLRRLDPARQLRA